MRHRSRWFARALLCVLATAGYAMAVAPIAHIGIEPISPRIVEEEALGDSARTTTGLPTVVVGYKVYLEAEAVDPGTHAFQEIVSETWTMEVKPAGSTADIIISGDVVTFVPDSVGSYQIGVTVTNDSAQTSEKALLWITAAKFVGVGTMYGQTASGAQCGVCHSGKVNGWATTSHSDVMQIRTSRATFADRCLSCHTVGRDTLFATGGLDAASGFVMPSPWGQTALDSIKTNHPEQAAFFNIQCENCHGPGSEHMAATDKNQISASFNAGVCASCHDAPTHHIYPIQWDASAHANYGDITGSGHASGSSCTRCHTAQGFVNETIDGGPAATYDHPDPITCAACHDPHDGTAEHLLRRGSVAEACTGCHTLQLSGYSGLHHSHQGSMILGEDGMELPGYDYPNSAHSEIDELCVTCHMAEPPDGVPEGIVGGHTFAVDGTDTVSTPGTEIHVLNSTGCEPCHGTVSHEFVELSQEKVHKLLDSLNAMVPTYPADTRGFLAGEPVFSADSLTEAETIAAYNWRFVVNDGSYGVHNIGYATALLKASIAELRATSAAGEIVAIVDVPNDQGGKVRVIWNAFAAEGSALETVTKYSVLRWDEENEVWVTGGSAEATGQDRYALDVATDWDTPVGGDPAWEYFQVVANTIDPQTTYWSNVDSGQSIDNLEPSVPGAPKLVSHNTLVWRPSPEEDVRYYAVFRTGLGTPFSGEPYMTTVDTQLVVEAPFRYGVSAVDFSGNMSEKAVLDVETLVGSERPLPATTALLGNAPNPFNPNTTIRYQLHQPAELTITIFNVLGQPVRTLVSGNVEAGVHSVVWDGRNDNGLAVSSGAYLYVMRTASGQRDVKRMLLVK